MGCGGSMMEDLDEYRYDSTWDDEPEEQHFIRVNKQQTRMANRNLRAAQDMQNFRQMCRNHRHAYRSHGPENKCPNLDFYENKRPFLPNGEHIEEFHKNWFGDYTKLERVHSYIQWLFPTEEPGLNHSAQVLTATEIWHFQNNSVVKKRLLKSYTLMLDFYGIQLVSEKTGEVKRAGNWKERFENLNRHTHNNLRITRILKCLGILGLRRYQFPLVRFFLQETLVEKTLPQVKQSALDYFMFAVLDSLERKKLIKYAFQCFEPKEQFVWCPRRIQRKLLKQTSHSRTRHGARNSQVQNKSPQKRASRSPHTSAKSKIPRSSRGQSRSPKQNNVSRSDLSI